MDPFRFLFMVFYILYHILSVSKSGVFREKKVMQKPLCAR